METFERITKKNKQVRLIKTIGLSLLTSAVLVVIIAHILRIIVGYNGQKEFHYQELLSQIAYPNIDSEHYQHMTGVFSEMIHTERSKDLYGVPVAFTSQDTYYDWLGVYEDITPNSPIYFKNGDRAYSRETWDKLPVFYNINKPSSELQMQELQQVKEMNGQLVEMAITFDRLYSYEEIQKMVPATLKKNWFWIGTNSYKDSSFYRLDQLYGLRPEHLTVAEEQNVMEIIETVKNMRVNYLSDYRLNDDLESFLEKYGSTDFSQVEQINQISFAGLILTGKAEDFQQLEKADWVYASSIGITRPNHSYYELDME